MMTMHNADQILIYKCRRAEGVPTLRHPEQSQTINLCSFLGEHARRPAAEECVEEKVSLQCQSDSHANPGQIAQPNPGQIVRRASVKRIMK
eukprot:scaffold16920_cov106-Skeletonema_marinoi.AAC.1